MASRVLLIGLDGADPALISRWIAEGRLPNLSALARKGSILPLRSTVPPATFPAWTTCATGVNPGRHGIFDFTELDPDGEQLRFVNATFRRVPAVWNLLSNQGARVAVLGVPATWPPEPVNGAMVSGFDSPVCSRVDASFVHPRERFPEFRDWQYAFADEIHTGPGWHERALGPLYAKIEKKTDIAAKLAAAEPWDFMMVVFGETDFAGHNYWMYHDPSSPWFREDGPTLRGALPKVYEMLDHAVGRVIEAFGDALVMVVSDHGMGPASDTVIHLNNWLADAGFLTFSSANIGGVLKRVALELIPQRLRGVLFRRFRDAAGRAEAASRLGGLDRVHSVAWSEELNYAPSVRVWDPVVYEELYARLSSWDRVESVIPRGEAYEGPFASLAPDYLLQWKSENGAIPLCLRARGGPVVRRLTREEMWGCKERGTSGVHRAPGVFLASERVANLNPGLEDIAPTVLARMGFGMAAMEGQSLFAPDAPQTADAISGTLPRKMEYTEAEAAVLESRLRDLGYFE